MSRILSAFRPAARSILGRSAIQRSLTTIKSRNNDDGLHLDWPTLPWKSAQRNEPTGWWDNQDRRNRHDTLHEEEDALNVWMFDDVEAGGKYTKYQVLGHLLTMFGIVGFVGYLSYLYDAPSKNPAAPKEYPFDNLHLERGQKEPDSNVRIRSTYGGSL
ncbi:NADH dehydrogenase [ubiquinone] 1 beta subcomplex subunit 8, mitochondrial-like [Oscarella lobularis]|uniref:NADH dehydrogenase [ubiquinone] 1 beta subcomplex subunit 8, mitochondrial-like n=1 Tax=Oscarella lobularis TaxID=121494 RepID=UPI00331314E0